MMRQPVYILITIMALLCACSGKRDYSRWADMPPAGWVYGDTVSLLPVDTTLSDNDSIVDGGKLKVALRHSNAYPFSNIWLELTYHSTNRLMMRDTINIRLADIYGRWLGSGFGASYQQDMTVSPSATIDVTRPVSLRHIMRVDTLTGIEQVGVEIVRQ
ncbi:MAG: gliding motility lipoprotein GldH [Staphylococcus sp.]|nr:gliding motility lipoprotein GldH [Staphylococcus sp.]